MWIIFSALGESCCRHVFTVSLIDYAFIRDFPWGRCVEFSFVCGTIPVKDEDYAYTLRPCEALRTLDVNTFSIQRNTNSVGGPLPLCQCCGDATSVNVMEQLTTITLWNAALRMKLRTIFHSLNVASNRSDKNIQMKRQMFYYATHVCRIGFTTLCSYQFGA